MAMAPIKDVAVEILDVLGGGALRHWAAPQPRPKSMPHMPLSVKILYCKVAANTAPATTV